MPDYRAAARKAAEKYGLDPRVFLAMIQQESGFNPSAGSPAGARGIAQFMPATARAYGVNLNDGRVSDDLDGAARYLRDNLKQTGGDYRRALSVYNSGRPDAYKNPGFAGGETYNYVRKIMAAAGSAPKTVPSEDGQRHTAPVQSTPGVDNSRARGQLLAQFLQSKNADPLQMAAQFRELADVPATTAPVSQPATRRSQQPSGPGNYTVAAGANRPGVPLAPAIKDFLAGMSASGRSFQVGTGSQHNQYTTSGNVSDHWEGNAGDIPATGATGDLIAAHAIRQATGMPFAQALAQARKGGVFNYQTPKGRVQVLWKTMVGGNHFGHVHVGVKP